MASHNVYVSHGYTQNATNGNAAERPVREYTGLIGKSPNRGWQGPGLDQQMYGNLVQTDDPANPIWVFRKQIMVPTQTFTCVEAIRCWNQGHQTGGGVGYLSGNATSQLAMDICSPQAGHLLPNGTYGAWDSEGVHHTKQYFERFLCGGGTYAPGPAQGNPGGIDWYRNTTKVHKQYEFDFDAWYCFEVVTRLRSDGTGFWTERVNGALWIDNYVGPLHLPGVSTAYYPNNAGKSGFETLEMVYIAASIPSTQQEVIVYHTMMQAGSGATEAIARAACIADNPTFSLGDHSKAIPGGSYPDSFTQATGTTVDDAGFAGTIVLPPPPIPANTPPGYEDYDLKPGASLMTTAQGELQAAVPGAADTMDTSVGIHDFGAQMGRVYVRDVIRLDTGTVLAGNLAFFRVLDSTGSLVYELYMDAGRMIWLWSPQGGMGGLSLNPSTGFIVPNDGVTNTRIEVSALPGNTLTVRINDTDVITTTGTPGGTTNGQKTLRAGIDHYDGSSTSQVLIIHGSVATSLTGWLGAPTTPPPPDPPPDPPPPDPPPDPPPVPPVDPDAELEALLEAALTELQTALSVVDGKMTTTRTLLSDQNEERLRLQDEVDALSKALEIIRNG